MKNFYSTKPVSTYTCRRICEPIEINGDLTKDAWKTAEKSRRFVDVIDGAPALYDSRAAMLYDDECLYVAFWCEEPFVRASLTERDSLVFSENDIEVFIDGGETYYEFQLNALNTIYEIFYIWKDSYQRGGKYDIPEFDLLKAQTFGGNHDRKNEYFWQGTHPRGLRYIYRDWDLPGLRTAVRIDGEMNRDDKPSKGWTCEIALPWAGMKWLRGGKTTVPKSGDTMRIFLGRYQILRVNGQSVQVGWAIDEVGTNDNHAPERFTNVVFAEDLQN